MQKEVEIANWAIDDPKKKEKKQPTKYNKSISALPDSCSTPAQILEIRKKNYQETNNKSVSGLPVIYLWPDSCSKLAIKKKAR